MPTSSPDSDGRLDDSPGSEAPGHISSQVESSIDSFKLLQDIPPAVQQEIDLIDAILQAPSKTARQEAIDHACKVLGKHRRSIMRKLKRLQEEGITSLARGRKDNGQFRVSEQWVNFIVKMYKRGQKESLRWSQHKIYELLTKYAAQGGKLREKKYADLFKGYPEVLEDLTKGKHPSHPTVYKIINHYLFQQKTKARHPGAFPGRLVVQTTEGVIALTHSNQVWQIDHTKLDILLVIKAQDGDQVDDGKKITARPYLTLVIDSYSSCVAGYYLGFEPAGSHEVSLAMRNAILPKQYGQEYKLQSEWNVYGVPDYVMTDRAKEFKSEHLKQISLQLGFQRRLRAFPSAGGLVESHFDKINKEVLSEKLGYTGSSVEERPQEAERSACLTLDELERELVRYFVDHSNQHFYSEDKLTVSERMKKPKRFERWRTELLVEPEVLNERELDICLMKSIPRKVEKYGCVRFEKLRYQGDCLASKTFEGKLVTLRYDQRNIATLLVYSYSATSQIQEFIGTVEAVGLERERFSLGEWEALKQKMRDQEKEIDNSVLIAERLASIESTEKKLKSKRQRIKKAHTEHERKSNKSKVVELYPERATEEATTARQENVTSAPDVPPQKAVESTQVKQLQQPAKSRRVRAVVPDWNQIRQDNW